MNMKKIAVLSLLAGGLIFAGAQTANAADDTNVCEDGYVMQYDDNGDATGCVVDATTFDVTDTSGDVDTTADDSCWVDDSGNNVCARTFTSVPAEEPTPTPIPIDGLVKCIDTTEQSADTSGNEMTQCDNAPIMYDNIMQTSGVQEKALTSLPMATDTSDSSNTLLVMGILVGLAGAGAIGFQALKAKKK